MQITAHCCKLLGRPFLICGLVIESWECVAIDLVFEAGALRHLNLLQLTQWGRWVSKLRVSVMQKKVLNCLWSASGCALAGASIAECDSIGIFWLSAKAKLPKQISKTGASTGFPYLFENRFLVERSWQIQNVRSAKKGEMELFLDSRRIWKQLLHGRYWRLRHRSMVLFQVPSVPEGWLVWLSHCNCSKVTGALTQTVQSFIAVLKARYAHSFTHKSNERSPASCPSFVFTLGGCRIRDLMFLRGKETWLHFPSTVNLTLQSSLLHKVKIKGRI